MATVKQKVENGYNIYNVDINLERLNELKAKEVKLMKDSQLIKGYQLITSCGHLSSFKDFMDKDYHEQYDFYFDEDPIDSGSNDYIMIAKLDNQKEMKNYLKTDKIPSTFELRMLFLEKLKFQRDTLMYDQKLMSEDKRLFFAFDDMGYNYGGSHTSVGYCNNTLIQITPTLYYIYKLLEKKYSFIEDAIERKYKIDELLSTINYEFNTFISNQTKGYVNICDRSPLMKRLCENKQPK